MSPYALDLWVRAKEALQVAEYVLPISPNTAASHAYYAAFWSLRLVRP